ncbi:MAG: double-strand break repair protein AddB, partial [Sphingomonadales bacterium]
MSLSSRPRIYSIPAHRSFADALAAGLIARHGADRTGLARGMLLLPNKRAVRAITDAFVRRSGGGLLLPRLVPIGDDELEAQIGGALDPLEGDASGGPIPPAVASVERLMILARLVQIHLPGEIDSAEALRLAEDLAATLDQLLIEEVDPARLRNIAVDLPDLSLHWQASLARLTLILDEWPKLLAGMGRIDAADRRNRILNAIAGRWRATPPRGFVVAAGINSTAPAVARLLRAIAFLPEGTVVLPALDQLMPEEEWTALGPHEPDPVTGRRARVIETHPQFHLKLLLDRMGIHRDEVAPWRWGGGRDAPAVRSRAIAHAMAPAMFTSKWQILRPEERRLGGVRALELADPAEEAQAAALCIREALEVPDATAALVTPDRALARRVVAHLKRWGIVADDSAGQPLSQTPPGTLLLLIAEAAAERFAPVPLLALLKHPLVRKGDARLAWLDGARSLDRALRGPRPPAGLAGIGAHLAHGDPREREIRTAAAAWWTEAAGLLEPLESAFAGRRAGLSELLAAVRDAASLLTGDEAWSGPTGRCAADLLESVEAAAQQGPAHSDAGAVAAMLEQMMDRVAVRPAYGQHPRVFVWGLLEARLQHADLMILSGLNEGSWPALPSPDPWLAPRIRQELGLPGLDRRIGLAAHDFAAGLAARQVI